MLRTVVAMCCLVALAASTLAQGAGQGGLSKQDIEKAQQQVQAYLDKVGAKGGTIDHLGAAPLAASFPNHAFFSVRFRIYPIAREQPEGLGASNLFAVPKGGTPERLKEVKALEEFFRKHAPAADKNEQATSLVQAWLWLGQEFQQDGMFKFDVKKEVNVLRDDRDPKKLLSATGQTVVMAGGNGDIKVMVKFGQDGKVAAVTQAPKMRAGPRPICQATKLLDPDPIVRRMAEQDLLYLGTLARDYLMEQRAKANPELRRAIDRLWQRILAEAW